MSNGRARHLRHGACCTVPIDDMSLATIGKLWGATLSLLLLANTLHCGPSTETSSGTQPGATAVNDAVARSSGAGGKGAGGASGAGGTPGTGGNCPSSVILMKRCFLPDVVPGVPKIDSGVADG